MRVGVTWQGSAGQKASAQQAALGPGSPSFPFDAGDQERKKATVLAGLGAPRAALRAVRAVDSPLPRSPRSSEAQHRAVKRHLHRKASVRGVSWVHEERAQN